MFFINMHLDYIRNSMVDEIKNFKIPQYLQLPIWVIIILEALILLTTFALIITNIEFFFNKHQVNTLVQANISTN